LGPGLITGAADDDPSGIATYSQAGAQFGFAISWTMLFSYPLMAAIQEISARIGRTTGKGIAGNLRAHFPPWILPIIVALLFAANTINIGADLGAMGDSVRLLVGGNAAIYVALFAGISTCLQIFLQYKRYVSVLKWLTLSLPISAPYCSRKSRLASSFGDSSSPAFPLIRRSGPSWSPYWAPPSALIYSFGRRRRRSRTRKPVRCESRLFMRRNKRQRRSGAFKWTLTSAWHFRVSSRSPSWRRPPRPCTRPE
jgi:hypothetical protein